MIVFRRLGGELIALNPDLIERVEATPDTVVTLVDEKKFLVEQSLDEVLDLIRDYRASIIARADDLQISDAGGRPVLHVVPNEHVTSPEVLASVADAGVDLEFGRDVETIADVAELEGRDWVEKTVADAIHAAAIDEETSPVSDETEENGRNGFLGFGGGRN